MANGPTARVLQLLSLLQSYRRWGGAELAERLEVSARTLRRDVDRLRSLGYPVEATPGAYGGYRLAAGAHLPPLMFDDHEAVAIAIGLRTAAAASIDGVEDASLGALAKLDQILPDRLRRRVAAVHASVAVSSWGPSDAAAVDAEALATLARACRDHEETRFDYESRAGEATRRLVEPHQLVSVGRRWYLAAWDLRRDDWRTFRLDRLSAARLAGRRFTPRELPGGDAPSYIAQSLGSMPRAFEVTIRVGTDAATAHGALGWVDHDIMDANADASRIRLRSDSREHLVAGIAVLAMTADVHVEEPAEMATLLTNVAAALGRAPGSA